ncbi:hypothetical protein LYSHEL_09800 [Lysobacter helvus]|uniref:Uncharacterized protein n=2 Tax=Lysobacteraceae TaxID=32033 RepID=A0ABN6FTV0_9GAMM|nr:MULTISPECIES: hypothetical protein [Lysobacter]BCT91956.1 hypothetical protein LYSCAS_09800 [Lysobacter caseinilyticus]BCT95109.1 hypothetical protein LYSHEL_09800 [Lysobacter helvus]
MSKRLYFIYVVVVLAIVLIAGREDEDRSWGSSAGRSGWTSGGGHK